MGKYFVRDTPLAGLEREMMLPPNFAPRGSSSAILCGYRPHGADVDCQSCIDHRRQSSRTLVCLHITERLQAGAVTMVELAAETVRPWKHPGLKQRAIGIAGRLSGFHFEDQLHVARMLKMIKGEEGVVNSHWLAAVYLLSAHAGLWQKTIAAVEQDRIDFASIRLGDTSIREYILYRVAKGLCSNQLGASSEELADPELVSDDTLLLVLCAVLIARYGLDVMPYEPARRQKREEKKSFSLPSASPTMRRVYAYLLQHRGISREVLDAFVHAKLVYESAEPSADGSKEYHNAVFVGYDEHGVARHAHKRGLYTFGEGFKRNVTGCDSRYSFHCCGTDDQLYVFEAPVDMLSFITLHPEGWHRHSYVSLCGTSQNAMMWILEQNPNLRQVALCLDNDEAGIKASQRLSNALREKGYSQIEILLPSHKDWNEDLTTPSVSEAQGMTMTM